MCSDKPDRLCFCPQWSVEFIRGEEDVKCCQHTSKNIITTSGSVRSKAVNCGSQAPVGTSWHSSLEPQNGSSGVSMQRSGAQT